MQNFYTKILELVVSSGKMLVPKAGISEDIGVKKAWLTQQDIDIEMEFSELIKSFGPTHVVFGEEVNNTFIDSEYVWIIDPISHTFAFIHGLPHYAVVVALLHKGQAVFSAVYDPSIDELFVAEKGKGTTLNGKKVTVTQTKDLCFMYDSEMEATWITKEKRIDVLFNLMNHGRSKAFGSAALTYAYVACGRAQGAIDINKDPFTTFAGELLVEEAGGTVTDGNGQNITLETKGIIASNGAIHGLLLGAWNHAN